MPTQDKTRRGMVRVPGGTFLMGSELPEFPEEAPVHEVTVDGFWMDATAVTVAEFGRFVRETGYVTVAERALDPADYPNLSADRLSAGSIVFFPTDGPTDLTNWTNWWHWVTGASWRQPEGPGSTVSGRANHPVVHVCWEDVETYATWAGKELPGEAEWEFAARGGLRGATYTWGDELMPDGKLMANMWIGEFPWQNVKSPQNRRTMPVASFPPNGYGLYDMAGNVWEWTADFYRSDHRWKGQPHGEGEHVPDGGHACCAPAAGRVSDPEGSYAPEEEQGGLHVPRRVIKGGSHLCALNYCQRYRPGARQPQQVESSMSHIGFRCIVRA